MSKAFTAISYLDDPERFLAYLGEAARDHGIITPTQFQAEDVYQRAIEGDLYTNLSFVLEQGDAAKAVVLAHKLGQDVRYNHLGVSVTALDTHKKVVSAAVEALIMQAQQAGATSVFVDDRAEADDLSDIGAEAFNNNGHPYTKLEAVIDLSKSEEELHKELRKSYKSLVNQGRKEMSFVYVTAENADHKLFEDFRNFHKSVAGRVTRPQESWDAQYEMVKAGDAELILGYLEPHGLVSSALFNDNGAQSVYSVAVYNRDLFDYPLAHANVYEGICRAKARGQKFFYLGQIAPYGTVDEKEFNIGKFKKGFCDRLKSYIEWQIPLN